MEVPSFWKLSRDDRYRVSDESGFPESIGGRATDLTQLAYSVTGLVREHYPINSVPLELVTALSELTHHATETERLIALVLERVSADALQRIKSERGSV